MNFFVTPRTEVRFQHFDNAWKFIHIIAKKNNKINIFAQIQQNNIKYTVRFIQRAEYFVSNPLTRGLRAANYRFISLNS